MAEFTTILTNTGLSEFANAIESGSLVSFSQIAVGDSNGSYYTPTKEATQLKNERWRGAVTSIHASGVNKIEISTMIPANEPGGYYIREIGIYNEQNKLLAIGKVPESFKPGLSSGSTKDLNLKIVFEVSNTDVINMSIDPNVSIASNKYVQEQIEPITQQLAHNEELVVGVGILGEMYPRALEDGEDDAPRIRRAISDATLHNIGTIRFTGKRLNIKSTIDVPEGIDFEGVNYASNSGGIVGTKIERKSNVVAFRSTGASVIGGGRNKSGIKFKQLYLHGGDFAEDFAQFTASSMLNFEECHFMAMGGRQLLLLEVMDSRITNCVFEWGGNTSGTIPAVELKSGDGYEYTNQVHFVGCRWESYRGTAIKSSGGNTNEIFFTNCKFESLFSTVPHIDFTNVNVISFDNVNVCSKGTSGTTLNEQVKLTNCNGLFGTFFLEHTGAIDTTASKINRFVYIENSSYVDMLVYVYQNGNNILSSSCVMVDLTSNDHHISVRGFIRDDEYTKTICNTPEKVRSMVMRNKNPYLRFARPDVGGEYWDHGRVVPDGSKTKYQFIHGDKDLGERPIFEVNANSDFKIFRDLMMEGRAVHLARLSSPPYGREGSMYYDEGIKRFRGYQDGAWRNFVME